MPRYSVLINLIAELHKLGKKDITVSITGEMELLLWRKVDDNLKNIIIDNDGDIEILEIKEDRKASWNKNYFSPNRQSLKEIAEFF